VYAHSEGGLVTQQAIADAKAQLALEGYDPEQALSGLHVSTYGTAEGGWPVGPKYEHWNNLSDPVPFAISGAQANYPEPTDNDSTPTLYFNQPFGNPIEAHSITDVYANKIDAAPGYRECKC